MFVLFYLQHAMLVILGGGRNVVWKSLRGHTGCVNALAFSPSTGSSLYSGGDDSRVLVWRADGAAYVDANPSPAAVMKGHHASNVFCVDGDVTETKVMSGGNDCKVTGSFESSCSNRMT